MKRIKYTKFLAVCAAGALMTVGAFAACLDKGICKTGTGQCENNGADCDTNCHCEWHSGYNDCICAQVIV